MSATTKAERLKQKQDQDAVLGRVSLALARSQRLIDSWLPASGDEDPEDKEQENDQAWGGLPDRVGLGGQPRSDGLADGLNGQGGNSSELDKLRKQLLGKKGAGKAGLAPSTLRTGLTASKPMGSTVADGSAVASKLARDDSSRKRIEEDDDEEDEGRNSAFKSKKQRFDTNHRVHPAVLALQNGSSASDTGSQEKDVQAEQDSEAVPSKDKLKPRMSYLDQVLAERSEKKKKKKKKKKTTSDRDQPMTGD